MNSELIWWKSMSNCSRFLSATANAVCERKSVVMITENVLPFSYDFYYMLSDEIALNDSQCTLEAISADEADSFDKIEDFMFKRYCPPSVKSDYFPRAGYSKIQFLTEYQKFSLNRRSLYVRDLNENNCRKWLNFVAEYCRVCKSKKDYCAVFILEISNTRTHIPEIKNCLKANFDEYISSYDHYVYCTLLTADSRIKNASLAKYAAELAANLCTSDVELCSALSSDVNALIDNPTETYTEKTGLTLTENEADALIWNAQIKHLFPLLEDFRRTLVEKYKKELDSLMPFKTVYGVEIFDPYELDFGNISALISQKGLTVTKTESEKISLCRETRNYLAHMKYAPPQQVRKVFDFFNARR